jgi:hypothetical protein
VKLAAAALAFSMLAGAGGCDGSDSRRTPTEPGGPGPVAFETLVQASNPGQPGGTVREAVRDPAAWSTLWAELREGTALPEEPPAVDFSRDMVIAAAMETQGCVAKVTIRGIRRAGNELVVDLLEAPPAPNCVCITSERPIHVVKLARFEGAVRFVVEVGVTGC